jgi:DNA-binding CsgD family transcriptional regulator
MPTQPSQQSVLVATLGAGAPVIPISVQLLLRQGVRLTWVEILHTDRTQEPITTALRQNQTLFGQQPGWPQLRTTEMPIADVLTAEELDIFATALFTTLKRWIGDGYRVHLLLAGGRKPMAMLGMTVAQMLLGAQDRVWYLHSEESLRQSARPLLTAQDEARLISIPLPPLAAAPSPFARLFTAETPDAARRELAEADAQRRRHFVEHELTETERTLARLVVQEVLTVEELAQRLHKSPKTITNQLSSIYSKIESVFGLQPDRGVKREFLRRELAPYFAQKDGRG